jgi:Putative zinc-finger
MTCPISESDVVHTYVAGTLSEDETGRFEEHMVGCADCRNAVRLGAAVRHSLRVPRSSRAPWAWIAGGVGIAAALLFYAGARTGGDVRRLAGIIPPPFASAPVRGSGDSSAATIARGMRAYSDGNYREAQALLARATRVDSSPGVSFYLGVAQLRTGAAADARESLRRALSPAGNPYEEDARFYLAKAWLQLRNADSALAELEQLAKGRGALSTHASALSDSVRHVIRR